METGRIKVIITELKRERDILLHELAKNVDKLDYYESMLKQKESAGWRWQKD